MGVIDSLKKWFSAVTDPLCGASKVADDLNSTHQDFMRGFASLITTMMADQVAVSVATKTATDVATDMSGDGADAIVAEAMSYLQVSVSVTPTADLVLAGAPVRAAAGIGQGATEVSQLTELGTLSEKAAADVLEAVENAGVQIGEDAALDTVTEVVDGAAVAELGANPIADAAAIILTLITAFFFLKTLYDMAWAIYDAIQTWQKAATNACQPLPSLPQNPNKPQSPPAPTSLSQADKDLAEKLSQETGVPQSVIEDIISKNPGLSDEEYRLLVQYYQKNKTIPSGVVKVFTMVNDKGKTIIAYVTQAAINHIRSGHPGGLDDLTNQQLADLIEELLQEEPAWTESRDNKGLKSTVYYYSDVEIDGKYYTIGIVVSTTTPGRIITINTNQEN